MSTWQPTSDQDQGAVDLPREAVAMLEYSERHALLIAPYGVEGSAIPDFLYTAEELKRAILEGKDRVGRDLFKEPTEWRFVNPADILSQLEANCEWAKVQLQQFRGKIAKLAVLDSHSE